MKIVLDTNVYISSLMFGGVPKKCFDHCIKNGKIYYSETLMNELYEKLFEKFGFKMGDIDALRQTLERKLIKKDPHNPLPIICRDPDDNYVLQLAEFVKADFLITGDKDLLVLKKFSGTLIVTPSQFMEDMS